MSSKIEKLIDEIVLDASLIDESIDSTAQEKLNKKVIELKRLIKEKNNES